jgi:hypothetical protein
MGSLYGAFSAASGKAVGNFTLVRSPRYCVWVGGSWRRLGSNGVSIS